MADTKITALLTPQVTTNPATDVLPIVNIADTLMASSGSTRKITVNSLLGAGGTATLASATITGDLTVDTSTLKVDSANDVVLIGSATKATYGANKLEVRGASISDASLGANNTGNLAILTTDSQAIDTGGVLSLGGGFNGTTPYMFAGIAGRKETATNAIAQGYLQLFTTNVSNGVTERYRIAGDGVHTWRNVGGVAGTAMTLNSTGLGVGVTPAQKLTVLTNIGISATTAAAADDRLIFTENMGSVNLGSQIVWKAPSGNAYASIGITNGAAGNNGSLIFSTSSSIFGSNNVERMRIDSAGNPIFQPSATPATLGTNGMLTVNATSNTNLRFSYRGSDGTTRVANITLA